jgi:hypothetical protein
MRTRGGMTVARSRGKLKGKRPKVTVRQHAELMEVFSIGRATVYRSREIVSGCSLSQLPETRGSRSA